MLKRLNEDRDIAPIVAQFVPVKLDVDSDEYRQWRREHPAEGNSIPKLFVVRADGETLYGRSGSLSGDALPEMLIAALENSGRILSAAEVEKIVAAADRFEELQNEGDVSAAIKSLSKIKRIGVAGQIASYAAPASRLNGLVNKMASEVVTKLETLGAELESGEPQENLQLILTFLQLSRDYSGLGLIKPELTAFRKRMTSDKSYSQLLREAKVIDSAKNAKSKSTRTRAITKLTALIESSEFESIRDIATELLAELEE